VTVFGYDRYCDEVVAQAGQIVELMRDADPQTPVPTCPGWTLADLDNHIRRVLAASGEVHAPAPDTDLMGMATWFADTVRPVDPTRPVERFGLRRNALFWARRAACDLVIHRADAAGAVGATYELAPDLGADAIDELLDLIPHQLAAVPVGTSLHLHATDAPDAEWLIAQRPDGIDWRRDHAKATVAVRGPVTDLLLVFYRRLPPSRADVLGDATVLDAWLEHTRL
jgi:uncharacterized protein (TIGR03083 family)